MGRRQPTGNRATPPGHAVHNGGIGFEYDEYDQPMFTNIVAPPFRLVFEVAGEVTSGLYSALLAELGYLWDYHASHVTKNGVANFNDCWDDPESTFFPDKAKPMHEYRMVPQYWTQIKTTLWEAEKYGPKGFEGLGVASTSNRIGEKFAGHFTWQSQSGQGEPPPPGG